MAISLKNLINNLIIINLKILFNLLQICRMRKIIIKKYKITMIDIKYNADIAIILISIIN